jgi:TrpR-related protein YerC/YecD
MKWKTPEEKRLIEAILMLSSVDDAKRFLRDLMTKQEIDEFSKRFKTAEMLSRKIPYVIIEKETGFSSTTVARVAKWLKAEEGGYRRIIARLNHHYNSCPAGKGLS